jgi:copper chaperone CopZ
MMNHLTMKDDRQRDGANASPGYVHLEVSGMTCAGEAVGLERRLRRREGVLQVTVNPLTERAYLVYDPALVNRATLAALVEAAGYSAS